MNTNLNKYVLARGRLMPESHLRQKILLMMFLDRLINIVKRFENSKKKRI